MSKTIQFLTPYNINNDVHSEIHGISFEDPSLAQEEFYEDSKIDVILRRFVATGLLPDVHAQPIYADLTGLVDDYKTARDLVNDAQTRFEQLPAKLRQRFNDDPAQLMHFLADVNNVGEAIDLGLIEKPSWFNPSPEPTGSPEPQSGEGGTSST